MNEPQPYFAPLSSGHPAGFTQHDVAEASRIASEEQMARDAAMGRPRLPKPELPPIKAPVLPEDFGTQVADLDQEIFARGVPVSSEKLFELGKERFTDLLAADRKVVLHGSRTDLTEFHNVQSVLGVYEAPGVPRRKMIEQAAGTGKERDAVRRISDFSDLWKATQERAEDIANIYSFRDKFESLAFGQSILAQLSKDGRLRSHFFCGGRGRKLDLLRNWFSVLEPRLASVALVQPRFHLLAWLSDEKSPPASLVDLAREFFGVRAPAGAQTQIAQAALDGFLLDFDGWSFWDFVGRQTRTAIHPDRLAGWRQNLRKRFPAISNFHADARAAFYRDVGFGFESHQQFEPTHHRSFIDRLVQNFLEQVSQVLALAVEDVYPKGLVARFEGQVFATGKIKPSAKISAHLAKAFPGSAFELEFTEIRP
jgi:hypothetical protein